MRQEEEGLLTVLCILLRSLLTPFLILEGVWVGEGLAGDEAASEDKSCNCHVNSQIASQVITPQHP